MQNGSRTGQLEQWKLCLKWLTLPHRSKEGNQLAGKYGIRGIPALVIVSPDGETITKNGRGDVSSNPKGALASWQKP